MARVAFVTGGTRGIGKAIVQRLHEDGFKVAAGYSGNDEAAKAIADALDVMVVKGNVGSFDDCARAVKEVEEQLGPIDILVNNAGITRDNLLMRMKDEDWQSVLDTNLTSVYRASKAVLRGMMKARAGRIVNIHPSLLPAFPGAHGVAEALDGHPAVAHVDYAGLPAHPGHAVAAKQMSGFGGMVSFRLRGGEDAAMPSNQLAVGGDEARNGPAELGHAGGDLHDLVGPVHLRVLRVGLQARQRPGLDPIRGKAQRHLRAGPSGSGWIPSAPDSGGQARLHAGSSGHQGCPASRV